MMRRLKFLLGILFVLATLLPVFSSCGECDHVWEENGYVAKEPTDTEVGYRIYMCTLCGESKSEEIPKLTHSTHDYSKNQWASDNSYHWLVCSFRDCNVTTNKSPHTLYPSSVGYTCQICMTVVNSHVFTDKVDYDESCHWLLCDQADCPAIASKLPHTLDSASNCTACDYSQSSHTKHIFSKWEWDDSDHWLVCNVANCNEAGEKSPHTWLDYYDGGQICKDCKLTIK